MIKLTNLLNVDLKLKHVPSMWKMVVIMIQKPSISPNAAITAGNIKIIWGTATKNEKYYNRLPIWFLK